MRRILKRKNVNIPLWKLTTANKTSLLTTKTLSKMLKLNQKVLLPIHEAIGEVIAINAEKAVIRVRTTEECYDVVVTPEGNIPHTKCGIAEVLRFIENEFVFIKRDNALIVGKIQNIRILKGTTVCDIVVDSGTETQTTIMEQPLNSLHKIYKLYKQIQKMVKSNDKFTPEEKRRELDLSISSFKKELNSETLKSEEETRIEKTFLGGSND